MLRVLLFFLALGGALAGEQDALSFAKKPYVCPPLEFQVAIPEGWNAQQDRVGIVVRGKGMGFMVTREPFLHEPKTFAENWGRVLGGAGLETRVEEAKAGRYKAYKSSWETAAAAGRSIQVWRLYVPQVEMLYNISFSGPKGADLGPLVEGVLDSFKCTAPKKKKLEFQTAAESLGPRVSLRLPKGYEKAPDVVALGGGARSWSKTIPGYEKPHIAGTISIDAYDARISYEMENGSLIPGSNVKKLVQHAWLGAQEKLPKILKKGRGKAARISGLKGHAYTAKALSPEGLPKHFYAFGGKVKNAVIVITIIVDEREERLYKNIGKQICSQLVIKE